MRPPSDGESSVLPTRFPVGARYVVEGHGGEDGRLRVFSRYVLLPGGQRINIPSDLGQLPRIRTPRSKARRSRSRGSRAAAKKNMHGAGTRRQQRH